MGIPSVFVCSPSSEITYPTTFLDLLFSFILVLRFGKTNREASHRVNTEAILQHLSTFSVASSCYLQFPIPKPPAHQKKWSSPHQPSFSSSFSIPNSKLQHQNRFKLLTSWYAKWQTDPKHNYRWLLHYMHQHHSLPNIHVRNNW